MPRTSRIGGPATRSPGIVISRSISAAFFDALISVDSAGGKTVRPLRSRSSLAGNPGMNRIGLLPIRRFYHEWTSPEGLRWRRPTAVVESGRPRPQRARVSRDRQKRSPGKIAAVSRDRHDVEGHDAQLRASRATAKKVAGQDARRLRARRPLSSVTQSTG